jgi:hypothetical protein
MSDLTSAQEEFNNLFLKNADNDQVHPDDRDDDYAHSSGDEEDRYRASQIDAAMRMPTYDRAAGADIKLPPPSFDAGRTTGVKGVIADARAYENARRGKWKDRMHRARQSVFGFSAENKKSQYRDRSSDNDSDGSATDPDEEAFLEQWRESRRRELEADSAKGNSLHNRRTSPSVRIYGRLDEVDALGYLDAIEKVGRETVVVVLVTDSEVSVPVINRGTPADMLTAHCLCSVRCQAPLNLPF